MQPYRWVTIRRQDHRFLDTMFAGFGLSEARAWVDHDSDNLDRGQCAGLLLFIAQAGQRAVAIAWSDFRVNGGALGRTNSRRFAAFLDELDRPGTPPIPLVYIVNSAGVNLAEGRCVFSDTFALWPALLAHSHRAPLYTCAIGKCLGLAALLFGLGHYRMAVAGATQLNLTGPEVIAGFFGEGIAFEEQAAAERCHDHNDLVHELVPSLDAAIARCMMLLAPDGIEGAAASLSACGSKTMALLGSVFDHAVEVIPGWSARVRAFVGRRNGCSMGALINPPERSDNMITVRTLDKYAAALDLFRAMELPIISMLDSPGIDPRFEQSDANNLRRALQVGEKIIQYPHGKMGVIAGRCFGGAATLAFPKVFGGDRVVALRCATLGVMHDGLVTRLLAHNRRLNAQWQQTVKRQEAGLGDVIDDGSLDAIIDLADLPHEVDHFLLQRQWSSATRRREAV